MKKVTQPYIDLATISDLHELVQYAPPRHPLISVIDHADFYCKRPKMEGLFRFGFYTISCKRFEGLLYYGKSQFDFRQGSLLFTAPGQIIGSGPDLTVDEGWALFIHPDLLHGTDLGKKMHQYSFFHYEVNEALHISEEENKIIKDCIDKIAREYTLPIDKHTQSVMVSTIELLLNYCNRFYDRQFYTRAKVNADVVQRFETLLKDYFNNSTLTVSGLPPVTYFASKLNLSTGYLSDLLQKFTGKSTVEHIHLELVEKAKSLLWGSESSISEIAYELGFAYPSHFTKIFKAKTGKSPSEYRHPA
ncbi:helix-turn-helix domain-containing protein [Chitinophaga nivalis]|uniref:Helix-turn-helix domain-containing protein n=1 Tax=Chitinophaga nivalis TaxID=2991709 RepID=A0ABT3IIW1_9BACT|nr:helix-turn-helix domain-containing protein [Chitinophaga nivalis]MCW3466402.1 helix-turn-helix domain-containing protein [Chitinophaga nivalis]MCW3483907.1 helix-turn-helix domain-containing protein [Chitinophaga nivalis]